MAKYVVYLYMCRRSSPVIQTRRGCDVCALTDEDYVRVIVITVRAPLSTGDWHWWRCSNRCCCAHMGLTSAAHYMNTFIDCFPAVAWSLCCFLTDLSPRSDFSHYGWINDIDIDIRTCLGDSGQVVKNALFDPYRSETTQDMEFYNSCCGSLIGSRVICRIMWFIELYEDLWPLMTFKSQFRVKMLKATYAIFEAVCVAIHMATYTTSSAGSLYMHLYRWENIQNFIK